MAGSLAGHVALITGGGRGIGQALAGAFARAGAAVAVMARTPEQLDETVGLIAGAGGRALAVAGDVSVRADVERAIASIDRALGPVSLLVNNAGISGPFGPVWEVEPDWWWQTMEVHLHGAFLCARAVLPGMIARGGGRIITVASRAAERVGPNASAYALAKAAQVRLTEHIAADARPYGVSAFVIHPGFIFTQLGQGAVAREDTRRWQPEFHRRLTELEQHPEQGTPMEAVTDLCLFLADGRGDALSGRYISVDEDVTELARRAETIREVGLYTLQLRTLAEVSGR
jgi:NAD(P)-dependent dehydrogenase (short-subunit alcohol dehydrogenase family)